MIFSDDVSTKKYLEAAMIAAFQDG